MVFLGTMFPTFYLVGIYSLHRKSCAEKEGNLMAGYHVTAIAFDQDASSSRYLLAVSVTDSNGSGVSNLGEPNFTALDIMHEARFSVVEVQNVGAQGFYRLFLSTELPARAGDHVIALLVTNRHPIVGRVPGNLESGSALVKVKTV
jgi:hypothetical protein